MNEYFRHDFELNNLQAIFNVWMNNQNLSSRASVISSVPIGKLWLLIRYGTIELDIKTSQAHNFAQITPFHRVLEGGNLQNARDENLIIDFTM